MMQAGSGSRKASPAVFIGGLGYAIGARSETVEEAAEAGRVISSSASLREAGFARHHFCEAETSSYVLAREMVSSLGDRVRTTGGLVYATSLPVNGNVGSEERYRETRDVKHLMDFPASHLQAEFGLEGAMVLGINQLACTSLLGAIRLASMMVRAEPELGDVLCVTADRFPEGALYEQSYNLISDGAAGCVVSLEPAAFRLLAAHSITNGAMAFASDDETIGSYFTYTHRLIRETLDKVQMTISDVDWIVAQNINLVTWQVMSSLLRFDRERVLMPTMPEVGHMISGDNIANLKVAHEAGQFTAGDRILMPMAGYGLNWYCLLLETL